MTTSPWHAVVVLVLALAACAQPPVPQDQFYRLQVAPPATPLARPTLRGVLEVQRFTATGLAAERPIVFSSADDPNALQAYHYHFWSDPPGVLLRDQLVSYLRAAGVAATVVTPDMRLEPEFVLTGRIVRLEQILGGRPKAAIELEMGVRATARDRLVLLRTYLSEVPIRGDGVTAAVKAVNEALAEIYARFVADLSAI